MKLKTRLRVRWAPSWLWRMLPVREGEPMEWCLALGPVCLYKLRGTVEWVGGMKRQQRRELRRKIAQQLIDGRRGA
jgi:hypothetical protein